MTKNVSAKQNRGFTLVMSVALLFLIALISIGMLGLSSIELRRSGHSNAQALAKANARMALMLALGNLQKNLGPDQRVSAPASLNDASSQPHWVGAWSTRAKDGSSFWKRDDANGGLTDLRGTTWNRDQEVLRWLVSGNEFSSTYTPSSSLASNQSISLVDQGSLGSSAASQDIVRAPLVKIKTSANNSGTYAYWVGDEGVKANIATVHAYDGKIPNPTSPGDGGYFSLLNSQAADESAVFGGKTLDETAKSKLVSQRQLDLIPSIGKTTAETAFHNATTYSQGVIANVREGRLKRDLTAYLESTKTFPDLKGDSSMTKLNGVLSPGLSDTDNLVGPANSDAAAREGTDWTLTRHQKTSPRFSIIRDYASEVRKLNVASTTNTTVIPANTEKSPKIVTEKGLAVMNNKPSAIGPMDKSSLQPILVEGSFFMTISYYDLPAGGTYAYNIRFHTYPRVVLWNPYNVPISVPATALMFQGNGRLEFQLLGPRRLPNGSFSSKTTEANFFINTGRNANYGDEPSFVNSSGYNDPYVGCWYYSLPATNFQPGECLVFSPERSMAYSFSNILNNRLSCTVPPDPSRDMRVELGNIFDPNDGTNLRVDEYTFGPTPFAQDAENFRTQADDQRMILKLVDNNSSVSPISFDSLRQVSAVSCSLQYGAGREPRVSWNSNNGIVRAEKLPRSNPVPTLAPNVRTREGYRLRWFQEHTSNIINSGALRSTPYMQEAFMANWNPRAAYATRSPWDNIGGKLPASGDLGGPYFFGAYTRDLFDQAVSWNDQMPVFRNGRYQGNPFGPPQEGRSRIVLFDVPRKNVGLVSLAQLQHAKFSEFVWHPSYAFGNSLIDPRIAGGYLNGMNRTAPVLADNADRQSNGFAQNNIGWSNDTQRSTGGDVWARHGRAYYQDLPNSDLLCYDLSYELNHSIWDDFFLSTGNAQAKTNFLTNASANPLPNGRIHLSPGSRSVTAAQLTDLHQPARYLMIDGAFNVNSTSTAAWEALLRSTKGLMGQNQAIAFPRMLKAPGNESTSQSGATNQDAWDGYRTLNDAEVKRLAEEIVKQVKLRGPFLSLSDFVNRRLRDDETGRMGPLQAAIEAAQLNQSFVAAYPLDNSRSLPDYRHPDNIKDATRMEQTLKPQSMAWGMPGYLTQADVLQVIGPALSARSDTFRIRAYGDATDDSGKVLARAYCEAIVQRLPDPLRPDVTGLNPLNAGTATDFGRQFQIISFRWLKKEEI